MVRLLFFLAGTGGTLAGLPFPFSAPNSAQEKSRIPQAGPGKVRAILGGRATGRALWPVTLGVAGGGRQHAMDAGMAQLGQSIFGTVRPCPNESAEHERRPGRRSDCLSRAPGSLRRSQPARTGEGCPGGTPCLLCLDPVSRSFGQQTAARDAARRSAGGSIRRP